VQTADRKSGASDAGTPNKATIGVKALLSAVLPDDRMKKEWNKWLRHRNPHIAFAAFKLANFYLFGKPVQPVVSEELAPPIRIDISAIPHRFERADSVDQSIPRGHHS
jgi:hypothetical protein